MCPAARYTSGPVPEIIRTQSHIQFDWANYVNEYTLAAPFSMRVAVSWALAGWRTKQINTRTVL